MEKKFESIPENKPEINLNDLDKVAGGDMESFEQIAAELEAIYPGLKVTSIPSHEGTAVLSPAPCSSCKRTSYVAALGKYNGQDAWICSCVGLNLI